jgi:hypothetical protein
LVGAKKSKKPLKNEKAMQKLFEKAIPKNHSKISNPAY